MVKTSYDMHKIFINTFSKMLLTCTKVRINFHKNDCIEPYLYKISQQIHRIQVI